MSSCRMRNLLIVIPPPFQSHEGDIMSYRYAIIGAGRQGTAAAYDKGTDWHAAILTEAAVMSKVEPGVIPLE